MAREFQVLLGISLGLSEEVMVLCGFFWGGAPLPGGASLSSYRGGRQPHSPIWLAHPQGVRSARLAGLVGWLGWLGLAYLVFVRFICFICLALLACWPGLFYHDSRDSWYFLIIDYWVAFTGFLG